jgi:hypothetical protein
MYIAGPYRSSTDGLYELAGRSRRLILLIATFSNLGLVILLAWLVCHKGNLPSTPIQTNQAYSFWLEMIESVSGWQDLRTSNIGYLHAKLPINCWEKSSFEYMHFDWFYLLVFIDKTESEETTAPLQSFINTVPFSPYPD